MFVWRVNPISILFLSVPRRQEEEVLNANLLEASPWRIQIDKNVTLWLFNIAMENAHL
jgi:hypothetical protein